MPPQAPDRSALGGAGPGGGEAPALDLHEGLSDPAPAELRSRSGRFPDARRGGCPRWPEHLWLLSTHGERVPGRCRATNLCDYCAKLAAVENTEMLALDACEGDAPRAWLVLTTRTATLDMAAFYRGREQLIKAIRRRWPCAEYACLLEFTTGYSKRSAGHRYPHWNVLLKGVPVEGLDRLREIVDDVWCGQVDALPQGQHVAQISEAGGLMRYIALHFQKDSQAPPKGFRGQRFNCSRGYFTGQTRAEARAAAKDSLQQKRRLHRAIELGYEGQAAEDFVDAQYAAEGLPEWGLYSTRRPPVTREPAPTAHVPAPMLEVAFEVADAGQVSLETAARLGLRDVLRKAAVRDGWDALRAGGGTGDKLTLSPEPAHVWPF